MSGAPQPHEVLGDIRLNSGTILRISCETRDGKAVISLRPLLNNGIDNVVRPEPAGIAIRLDKINDVIALLQAARLKFRGGGAL